MIDKENIIGELAACLQNLLSLGDYDVVLDRLQNVVKIKSLVNYYVYVISNDEKVYDEDDIKIIQLIIEILQEFYNNGVLDSPIHDDEYDILYELYRTLTHNEIVGASVGVTGNLVGYHKYPDLRGTLDKLHFITDEDKPVDKKEMRRSIEDWVRSIENKIDRLLNINERSITIYPKWDGISVIFECDAERNVTTALSRGDTDKNEAVDYTRLFKAVTNFSYIEEFKGHPIGIKTEIVMTQDNYEALCKEYGHFKSKRSAVSSIFSTKDLDQKYLQYITIIPLQVQNFDTKEIVIPDVTTEDYPAIGLTLDDIEKVRDTVKYLRKYVEDNFSIDIDGVVIRLTDDNIQNLLGREGNINKYEIALKFPPEQKKTILEDVEFSVGILGAITPVAKVKPVVLNGNKVESPSLGSIDIFERLNLNEGDEVIIKYNIVPYLEIDGTCQKGTGKRFVTPTHCSYCSEELKRDPVLRCINVNCDSRLIGKIANYVEKMRMPEISIRTIETLYKHGFLRSIGDLYRLDKFRIQISQLPRFGIKSIENIIKGINSRKVVYDYELLGSIGIVGIGRRMFKKILNIYYLSELVKICKEGKTKKLIEIGGIQEKTANKIIAGVILNADLIDFLCTQHKVQHEEEEKQYKLKVCFTKVRDHEFEEYLESKNVKVTESYSKDVNLLIVPSMDVSSSKVEDARKKGREVITLAEAHKMFEYK